jgi:Acyl-CoA dehydrogenase, C-terminal domain
VFVPDENLLGEENHGFQLVMANFQWERLVMAIGAVGSMEVVLERALEAADGRSQFRHSVAELAIKLEASRCLTNHALYLFSGGHDAIREVTEAKLLSQRAALEVAETAFRIADGDLEIGRALRDTRLGPDWRRHRRGDEGDPRKADGPLAARPACRGFWLVRPAAVLVEEAPRVLLLDAGLVALDADPVDHVEQQHGRGGADEHRPGRQPDPPGGPGNDHAGDEQRERNPVADEVQRHLEPTVAPIVMMPASKTQQCRKEPTSGST